jgi:N-acetyl-anhydromuramoyl-L-alanine amidase
LPQRLRLNNEGLVEGIRFIPSPNCDARPAGCVIDLLVIHHISLPPGEFGGPGIVEFFTNRLDPAAHPFYASIAGMKVSAHFLVRRDGGLIQFVPCAMRAWHAGESGWKGRARCNDFSVGIEVEGTGQDSFTNAQYVRLIGLTRALQARYPIADIVGHSDVAPGRKSDPGPRFDWARYRAMLKDEAEPQRTRRTQTKSRNRTAKKTRTKLRTAKAPRRQGEAKKK